MRRPQPKSLSRPSRKESRNLEAEEIQLLEEWLESGKPERATNPLSLPPLPPNSPIGRLGDGSFSRYAGCDLFRQLPISKKTKDGLKAAKFFKMTDVQKASLPHSLCERDILGAAKTGSGKTLAFVIPVLEKLHRARWGPEDGVGCLIISPTRELASQLFDVIKTVGKFHGFSAGLLIGGRKGVVEEKECVNGLNILVCTPGRLLQHMDETANFECSQLQILVLDEADRILDVAFKKTMNAIVTQLPKYRQTLLFSATQTKSVQDLARMSLKDPEYLSVHEEATTATPERLQQSVMIVPLDQKLDMLWSFIKSHLNSKILVFLTTRKQVKYVYEAFKHLRPGIPLKLLHGKMNQEKRLGTYSQFAGSRSVLFSTDVSSRGLDFDKAVDWVVQVDCPPDHATYIHRVGRTARHNVPGKSLLFLEPSEMQMLERLKSAKIPIILIKANKERIQPVSPALGSVLAKNKDMPQLAQRAFITYLKSVSQEKDKEVFDVTKLDKDGFAASLGLPLTPKVRFLDRLSRSKNTSTKTTLEVDNSGPLDLLDDSTENVNGFKEEDSDNDLLRDDIVPVGKQDITEVETIVPATRVMKKKKLKINLHRPIGTRVVFDDEGNTLAPLATVAESNDGDGLPQLDADKVNDHYEKIRAKVKEADKVDKVTVRKLRKEKHMQKKMKMKLKRGQEELESDEDGLSGSDEEASRSRPNKKTKLYYSDDEEMDNKEGGNKADLNVNSVSLAEQEALALKLLSSMHK